MDENRLEPLPEALRTLPLTKLQLAFNWALRLPDSILDRPPEEILRYYFESRAEKGRPLLELKLLLVGRGKAGKTTLVKRLAGEEPDANESETHSIASQTSLVRPYIKDPELRRARERHEAREVEIVVVKLEPCASDDDPFLGKLQRLAPKFRSIAETNPRSVA